MKRCIKAAACCFIFGLAAYAQDDAALVQSMKSIGGATGALRKMDNKSGDEAVAAATKIVDGFTQTEAYWSKHEAPDAVKSAQDGKAAATELLAAVKAGDNDKVNASMKTLFSTCKPCHDAHREKQADNTYKIK